MARREIKMTEAYMDRSLNRRLAGFVKKLESLADAAVDTIKEATEVKKAITARVKFSKQGGAR